jgi:hypothetical protein
MAAKSALAELITPDILTPVQWYAGKRSEDPRFQGTRRLMLAVLMDALQRIQNGARSRTAIQRRASAEAEMWIADRKGHGPFAFETVCETLAIDPDWLRENLREWRRRLSGDCTHRQIRRSPTTRSGAIRSSAPRRGRKVKEVALAGQ